ncbi:MAG: glycoside hydrolase family 88 protein [Clostridia bacterium]|nr:glycoside hydrolase family 88 protein [Clostridia bacterium]
MVEGYLERAGEKVARCLMAREGLLARDWSYDYSVVFRGMEMLYHLTGDAAYRDYVLNSLDQMVDSSGHMRGYRREAFNLDYLCLGKDILWCLRETGEEKYRLAAKALYSQLEEQPRTSDGGFWHKQVYPYQMWLDGQHMAVPFYVEAAKTFGEEEKVVDALRQLVLAWEHTLDPVTGLPCHGWDEQKVQIWADPETGRARHAWGRAVGWYMVALADTLSQVDPGVTGYREVLEIFGTLTCRLLAIRQEGVWLQVLDCPGRCGNYLESSGSSQMVYAMLRGARAGLLPEDVEREAMESYRALQRQFLGRMRSGEYFIAKCCQGAGLGGSGGRDGSFDYYISETVTSFDLKGTGAFIQAASEAERREMNVC